MATITENLAEINASLQTIANAIQGGKVTIDLSGVEQALKDLKYNDIAVRFGNIEFSLTGLRVR